MKKFLILFTIIFLMNIPFALNSQNFQPAKPWMGISIENSKNGVRVKGTIAGTPAEKAGFLNGDIIKKIDGNTMMDSTQLISYIQSKGVGNEILVEYERYTMLNSLKIKLEARPDELELIRKKLIGNRIPDFKLERVTEKGEITQREIENSITVIEFWATWCPACIASHPKLSKFAEENKSIKVFAISNEDREDVLNYSKKNKYMFSILLDSTKDFIKFFSVSAIPMTIIVDKKGVIQYITLGAGIYLDEALNFAIELNNKK